MTDTQNVPTCMLPSANEFTMFQTIAKNAQASGLYTGIGGAERIFMIMLAARELGISPMLAINGGIWNIQGKIEISARLMNSMIRRSGHTLSIKGDDKACTITGKRVDTGETQEETFTIEMANKAGLVRQGPWTKYPEDMLYNRCMSRLARRLFPDVIGNAYVEGEIREIIDKDLRVADYEEVKMTAAAYEEVKKRVAAYEEVKKSKTVEVLSLSEEKTEELKMNEEQVKTLLGMLSKVDDQCKQNMLNYMKSKYNTESFKDLPANEYEPFIKGLMKRMKPEVQHATATT